MTKRALVIGSGGLFGTYGAGVATTLCRHLGPNYFDTIYGCSAGAFTAVMYAANQPDILEDIWRNSVDGKKLIDFSNIIRGRPVLNLEFLTDKLKSNGYLADITDKIFSSKTKLQIVVMETNTGNACYFLPTTRNIFNLLKASAALPLIHGPVAVNGKFYIDGGLADPLPIAKAARDGHEEIIAVPNTPKNTRLKRRQKRILEYAVRAVSENAYKILRLKNAISERTEKHIKENRHLFVIRPKKNLPLRSFIDTDKERINKTFDIGVKDALKFLKNKNRSRRK